MTPFNPQGREPRGGDEHDPWPAFWDAEAEQCFRTLKKLAYMIGDTNAVVAGVVVLLAIFIGLVFWIRGR